MDEVLSAHWRRFDGVVEEEEEDYVDRFDLPEGAARPDVDARPSAYGEVTRSGARQLFEAMGLRNAPLASPRGHVFVDLGSGAGRLVAQAWLELPALESAIGVELAPSRHRAAVRAWRSAAGSAAVARRRPGTSQGWKRGSEAAGTLAGAGGEADAATDVETGAEAGVGAGVEFRLGSMLDADLTSATHVYIASLCMGDELMDALWARLRDRSPAGAPHVEVVASLRAFRGAEAASALSHVARVECTWSRQGSPGQEVYVYAWNASLRSDYALVE